MGIKCDAFVYRTVHHIRRYLDIIEKQSGSFRPKGVALGIIHTYTNQSNTDLHGKTCVVLVKEKYGMYKGMYNMPGGTINYNSDT